MATNDLDFPAWLQPDGTLHCVTPMNSRNTQLRYGKYSALFRDTLRPARDELDQPVLGFTQDGGIRGQVMMGSGPRHVDVYAKRRRGARAQLRCHHPTRRPVEDLEELYYATHTLEVTDVRAQRLADVLEVPAMIELAPGTDWDKPAVKRTVGATAGAVWDALLETFRPVPHRFGWRHNPWVWIHRCRPIK